MCRLIILMLLLILYIPDNTKLCISVGKSIMLDQVSILHPMEVLDILKAAYADNFTKISLQENPGEYFYKLNYGEYYLVYEARDDDTGYYLFHLYEFVLDDVDSGIRHTVTYGWYWVNPYNGHIWEYP